MAFKVYKEGDLISVLNTDTWKITKRNYENVWYSYNQMDAPILYSLYQKEYEHPLFLNQPYTNFLDEDGNTFADDVSFQSYLGNILSNGSNSVSTDNSTTTLLTASSVFTGEWEDVSKYESIVVAVKTDQNGTFTIQFSPDGVNQDSTLTRYYRTDQIEAPHRFTITRKYARIVFTNTSASDQTYIRLQTSLGSYGELNAPADSTLAQDFDSTSVRPTNFKYEVALGKRQGAELWNKFGYNDDLDSGSPELVAAQDGLLTILTSASTLTISSSSASDSNGGVGANSIVIYGIDTNRLSAIEVVALDGLSDVVTTSTWLGINRVAIFLAGTSQSNVGNITIEATTGGSVQAYLPIGVGTTQQLIFFSQAGHQVLADWVVLNAQKISGGGNPIVTFKGWVYSAISNSKYEVFREIIDTSTDGHTALTPSQPFVIGESSVFYIEATTTVNNTVVSGRISLIEFKNVDS